MNVGADHGRIVRSIRAHHRRDDFITLVPCKIDVDIGRIFPLRVQEALEVEIMADGIHIGDPQTVRNDARGPASPAACTRGAAHDVGHDEEIG